MFGGVVGIIGSIIFVAIQIGFLILAGSLSLDETVKALGDIWPLLGRAVTFFSAGFVSGWIVAPSILRRVLSPDYRVTGFAAAGFKFGAVAGLLCSWLVVLITILKLSVSGLANGKGEETLRWTIKLFGYYPSINMAVFSFFAVIIGAFSGSLAEWCFRWFRKEAEPYPL
jgi:hypothetical protein